MEDHSYPIDGGWGSKRTIISEGLDEEDLQIERGELDPPGGHLFYPKGVLDVLSLVFRNKKFTRPRGKHSPKFSLKETIALRDFLFFRSPYVELRVRQRLHQTKEWPLKRKMFVKHFVGEAKYNGAKAARMAGYSPRSAKQIAYKIKQT